MRPVGSIEAGTARTLVGTVAGVVDRGTVPVPALVGGVVVDEPWAFPPDDPLQPASVAAIAIPHKRLQRRMRCVDSMVMEAQRCYPAVPEVLPRVDVAGRAEEIERVVATIASLYRQRLLPEPPREVAATPRRDPVAITAALHPRSLRSQRRGARRAPTDGNLGLRIVVFDATRRA